MSLFRAIVQSGGTGTVTFDAGIGALIGTCTGASAT
jgi:hypothetical protein